MTTDNLAEALAELPLSQQGDLIISLVSCLEEMKALTLKLPVNVDADKAWRKATAVLATVYSMIPEEDRTRCMQHMIELNGACE